MAMTKSKSPSELTVLKDQMQQMQDTLATLVKQINSSHDHGHGHGGHDHGHGHGSHDHGHGHGSHDHGHGHGSHDHVHGCSHGHEQELEQDEEDPVKRLAVKYGQQDDAKDLQNKKAYKALIVMMALTGSFMVVELVVGMTANSLSLVSDSFHMLSDVVGLLIGFITIRAAQHSKRKGSLVDLSWVRLEALGGMINSCTLVALCFFVFLEAIEKFISAEEVDDPVMVMIVGGVGLLVNILGLCLFAGHGHAHSHGGGHAHSHGGGHAHSHGGAGEQSGGNMNLQGVFLHVLGDAMGSVAVLVSGAVIYFTEWSWRFYLDPAVSLLIVLFILSGSLGLLRRSARLLLGRLPKHIDSVQIEKELGTLQPEVEVEEFHIFMLAEDAMVAWCYAIIPGGLKEEGVVEVFEKIREIFIKNGVEYTTIEPEFRLVEVTTAEDNTDEAAMIEGSPRHSVQKPQNSFRLHRRNSSRSMLETPSYAYLTLANMKNEANLASVCAPRCSLSPRRHSRCNLPPISPFRHDEEGPRKPSQGQKRVQFHHSPDPSQRKITRDALQKAMAQQPLLHSSNDQPPTVPSKHSQDAHI